MAASKEMRFLRESERENPFARLRKSRRITGTVCFSTVCEICAMKFVDFSRDERVVGDSTRDNAGGSLLLRVTYIHFTWRNWVQTSKDECGDHFSFDWTVVIYTWRFLGRFVNFFTSHLLTYNINRKKIFYHSEYRIYYSARAMIIYNKRIPRDYVDYDLKIRDQVRVWTS